MVGVRIGAWGVATGHGGGERRAVGGVVFRHFALLFLFLFFGAREARGVGGGVARGGRTGMGRDGGGRRSRHVLGGAACLPHPPVVTGYGGIFPLPPLFFFFLASALLLLCPPYCPLCHHIRPARSSSRSWDGACGVHAPMCERIKRGVLAHNSSLYKLFE